MFSCKCLRFSLLASALVSILTLSSLSFAAADRISAPIPVGTAANMTPMGGHISPFASPQLDQGPVEPTHPMSVTMIFGQSPAQKTALLKLLAEQQDRKSPNYHKWLTSVQFGEQFGLSVGDLEKVSTWLGAQGFKVSSVANGRDYITFSGYAAQVDSVFGTETHYFNVKGQTHFANTKSPMLPAALTGIVTGFRGLHDFTPHAQHKLPDYNANIGANTYHFLAPGDISKIYNFDPLYSSLNLSGQTIVIAGQSDVYLADLHYFRTDFGLSDITGCNVNTSGVILAGACTSNNLTVMQPYGDPGLVHGDLGESDLDIETISGVARGAKIIFVTSPAASGGVDASVQSAVDSNPIPANVISYSYGLCENFVTVVGDIAASESMYQKAQSEGISFFAAAGDAGAATCDGDLNVANYPAQLGLAVSYPASSQYVTAVGGTEFNEGTGTYWNTTNNLSDYGQSATGYIPELAWNDTTLAGQLDATGGGASSCVAETGTAIISDSGGNQYSFAVCSQTNGGFPKPTWQSGITGMPNDGVRDVPDIAFSASNANDVYIVCVPQSELLNNGISTSTCQGGITSALTSFQYPSAFGGTSASTPVTASMALMLNQYLSDNGITAPVGNINQQLYKIYEKTPGAFHDVTSGSSSITEDNSTNIVPCTAGTPLITNFPTALQCPGSGTPQIGYSAGTGYDQTTGLGSLNVNSFFTAWLATEVSFTVNATTLTPSSIAAGSSTTATSTVTITPAPNSVSQNATYTLGCSGLPSGPQCTFNPAQVTSADSFTSTLTISGVPVTAATGTDTITVDGTAGPVVVGTTVSLDVTATTESFTLTTPASGQTVTVAQGQVTSGIVITVGSTSSPSFISSSGGQPVTNAPVTYACSGLPSESQCLFSPSSTTNATSVSLTISTTAPSAALRMPDKPFDRGSRVLYAALLPGLLGVVLTFGSRKRSMAGMRVLGLIMVLGCSTMWLGACGGSNNSSTSNPGTPVGSSTVTVTATAGGSVPQQTFSFTLMVTAAAK